jgi:hypothetical protein
MMPAAARRPFDGGSLNNVFMKPLETTDIRCSLVVGTVVQEAVQNTVGARECHECAMARTRIDDIGRFGSPPGARYGSQLGSHGVRTPRVRHR